MPSASQKQSQIARGHLLDDLHVYASPDVDAASGLARAPATGWHYLGVDHPDQIGTRADASDATALALLAAGNAEVEQ
jgi:hypothetical protein